MTSTTLSLRPSRPLALAVAAFGLLAMIFLFMSPASAHDNDNSKKDDKNEKVKVSVHTTTTPTIAPDSIIEFYLRIRWGFVKGNPAHDGAPKNYDGSISAASTTARFNLIQKLQFESVDHATSTPSMVTWDSTIKGDWDGVLVAIRSQASTTITISTPHGNVTKTAAEWRALKKASITDFGNHELLVVNAEPYRHLQKSIVLWWGKTSGSVEPARHVDSTSTSTPAINFTGTLTTDTGVKVALTRTLKFERTDKITARNRQHIDWTSTITSGRDGIGVLVIHDRTAGLDGGVTLSFPSLPGGWSKHYSIAELIAGINETVTINGTSYTIATNPKKIPIL